PKAPAAKSTAEAAGATAAERRKDVFQILGIERLFGAVFGAARLIAVAAVERPFRRPLLAAGVDLPAIEPGPFLRIGQQFICGRDRLETLLGRRFSRVEIRMVLLGELAIRGADLVVGRSFRDAERRVGIIGHDVAIYNS